MQRKPHLQTRRAQTRTEERGGSELPDAPATSAARVERLGVLIRLRKLYRNLLRADGLLAEAAPVYQPYRQPGVCSTGTRSRMMLLCLYLPAVQLLPADRLLGAGMSGLF